MIDALMNPAMPALQDLARRLMALETKCGASSEADECKALRVCEKLRAPLTKFFGIDGYRSLMIRAVAMGKAETASLGPVQVQPNGSLDGITHRDAAFAVLVHLLSLLVTFVGERMTLRLLLDAWPGASLDEMDSSGDEQS